MQVLVLCIFSTTAEEATEIIEGDPAVQAGIFVFSVHAARGFPGDALPDPEAGLR
jgi:hypothetical protein